MTPSVLLIAKQECSYRPTCSGKIDCHAQCKSKTLKVLVKTAKCIEACA